MNKSPLQNSTRAVSKQGLRCASALMLALLTACSAQKPLTATSAEKTPARAVQAAKTAGDSEAFPAVEFDSGVIYQILASEIASQRGQPATAYATYMSLATKLKDPRLARRGLEIALREQNIESALESAQLWNALSPNNAQAAQSLTVLLVSTGKLEEALPRIQSKLNADKAAYAAAVATGLPPEDTPFEQVQRQLLRAPNKLKAYELMQTLFASDLNNPLAIRVLAAQAHFANLNDKAVEYAKLLLNAEYTAANAMTLAQYAQSTEGGAKFAIGVLEKFLKKQPNNTEVISALARFYTVEQEWTKARNLFEPMLAENPDNAEILYVVAGLAIQQNDRVAANRYFKRFLEVSPEDGERELSAMYLSLSQLAEEDKDYEDALKWLGKVNNPSVNMTVLVRKALIQGKQNKFTEALGTLSAAKPRTDSEKVQLALAEIQLLRDSNKTDAAMQRVQRSLGELPDQPDLLYEQAMLAEKLQQLDTVEKNLRRVIALRPDNPHAYNALGYSFADRKIRLEEAKSLIEKALELAPNDAFITDSLGWVLFRMGRNAEALEVLKRAYELKPDAEIAIHLGEVLWVMGDGESATKILRTVKSNAATNSILQETLVRLGIRDL
ncbi:MAG: tetratricopeptide repeat protein [Burkholderiales bacterium]|nr:tetratricopeptide repeat protein [Burkholderiales bacterium]